MKQSVMAEKLDLSPTSISKILNGRTPIQDDHAQKLMKLMKCKNREELQDYFPLLRFQTYETYHVDIDLKMHNSSFPSSRVSQLMRAIQALKDLGVHVDHKITVSLTNK